MIREIKIDDKEKLIGMMKEFYNSEAVLQPVPEENFYKTFDAIMDKSPYVKSYVVDIDSELAGYVLLSFAYSNEAGGIVLWIEEIYILPNFQNKGLGKDLLSFVENKYKGQVSRTRLEVEFSNKRAKKLYTNVGFSDLDYNQLYKETNQ